MRHQASRPGACDMRAAHLIHGSRVLDRKVAICGVVHGREVHGRALSRLAGLSRRHAQALGVGRRLSDLTRHAGERRRVARIDRIALDDCGIGCALVARQVIGRSRGAGLRAHHGLHLRHALLNGA